MMLMKRAEAGAPAGTTAIDLSKKPPPYPYQVARLIRHTAKEFAGAFYEGMQVAHEAAGSKPFGEDRSTEFRQTFKSQQLYIAWCWPMFVKDARTHLTQLLARPDLAQRLKDEIYEAITQDYHAPAFTPEAVMQIQATRLAQAERAKRDRHRR